MCGIVIPHSKRVAIVGWRVEEPQAAWRGTVLDRVTSGPGLGSVRTGRSGPGLPDRIRTSFPDQLSACGQPMSRRVRSGVTRPGKPHLLQKLMHVARIALRPVVGQRVQFKAVG